MIHSLSGGVIKDNGVHRLVKVSTGGDERYYLSDEFAVSVGDKVIVPTERGAETCEVLKVLSNITSQNSPLNLKQTESVINIVFED